jgi:hypothetical protein
VPGSDLQDIVDQVTDLLTDVYQPESSREDLASAIGDALDVLQGSDTGDDIDEDDGDADYADDQG